MVDAINRQMTLLWLIRKNDVIKNFKGRFYFQFRSLGLNFFHFFDQVRKHSVSKALKKKISPGQAANSSYVKCLYMGVMPRLNNSFGTPFDIEGLGNIVSCAQW